MRILVKYVLSFSKLIGAIRMAGTFSAHHVCKARRSSKRPSFGEPEFPLKLAALAPGRPLQLCSERGTVQSHQREHARL